MLCFLEEVSLVGTTIDEVDMVQDLGDAADQPDARRLLVIHDTKGKLREKHQTRTAKVPPFQNE